MKISQAWAALLLLVPLAISVIQAGEPPVYRVEILHTGVLPVQASVVRAISPSGATGGWVRGPGSDYRGYLNFSGTTQFPEGFFVSDLNDNGVAVGSGVIPGSSAGNGTRALVYSGGELSELPGLGGDWSQSWGVNAAGQIVGDGENADGVRRPFLFARGELIDLGGLGGPASPGGAYDINAGGVACGQSDGRAVLFSESEVTDVTTDRTKGLQSLALALNDQGDSVGWISDNPFSLDFFLPGCGFISRGGQFLTLGVAAADTDSRALDINNSGDVVGSFRRFLGGRFEFLMRDGVLYDLNELTEPGSPVEVRTAFAINDNKQIAAYGYSPDLNNGCEVACRLVPTSAIRTNKTATPQISPVSGVYPGQGVSVTIKCATPGAEIRWTWGAETVTQQHYRYEGPIWVSSVGVISAKAFKNGLAESLNATVVINIDLPRAAKPELSPPPGTYTGTVKVTFRSQTPGTNISYNVWGGTPNGQGGMPDGTSVFLTETTTVKAMAVSRSGTHANSPIVTGLYTILPSLRTAPAPVFSPSPGAYRNGKKIRITTPLKNSQILYGSGFGTDADWLYSPSTRLRVPTTVRARVLAVGCNPGPVVEAVYSETAK
jgi:probable HAF family extracellular repeat protein